MSRESMSRWQGFLDSLATKGGNTLLLVVLSLLFLAVAVVLIFKYGPTNPTVNLVSGAFTSFSGALLLSLKGENRTISETGSVKDDGKSQPQDQK